MAEESMLSQQAHQALVTAEVDRVTAALTAEKTALTDRVGALEADLAAARAQTEQVRTEAAGKVDVLEAALATAKAQAEQVGADFDAFRAEIDLAARVAELRDERLSQMRAAAPGLSSEYFSDERVERWARMPEEEFATAKADVAAAAPPASGEGGEAAILTAARTSAALSGDGLPTVGPSSRGASALGGFLRARQGRLAT